MEREGKQQEGKNRRKPQRDAETEDKPYVKQI